MKRDDFIKKGLMSAGMIVALPSAITSWVNPHNISSSDCELTPLETTGPFPIKTPAELMRANIVSDRQGVALLITLTVHDQRHQCAPMPDVFVDIWHCDAQGLYSEYGGHRLQAENLSDQHFLRGRQVTDSKGQVSFISVYPGWYPGRAPHIHVEVLDKNERSLRVTQIAFPEKISNSVYASADYKGRADTSNKKDGIFRNSLSNNMPDSLTGDITAGYTLSKTLVV